MARLRANSARRHPACGYARSGRSAGFALCDGDAVRPDDACQITFFHTRTAKCLRVRLPQLHRHRIIGFTDGLLILLHKRDTTIRVLHPFTGAVVDFPSLVPVYYQLIKNRNSVPRDDVEEWQRFTFGIFKLHASLGGRLKLIRVTSLGNRALFICMDRCLSVSAKDLPCISSNSLYLAAPLPNPVVVYHLSSQSFERPTTFSQVHDTKERIRPSVRPFTLADHLLTYCKHREWATGLMFHEFYFIPQSFEELWKNMGSQASELKISQMKV